MKENRIQIFTTKLVDVMVDKEKKKAIIIPIGVDEQFSWDNETLIATLDEASETLTLKKSEDLSEACDLRI